MSKISKAKRRQVFNNSKGLCANCKTKIDYSTHNWSLDHMREKQFGGSSDNDNLQAVCKQCHHWKNLIICANKTQGLIPTDEDLEEQQQRRIALETTCKIDKLTDLLDTYRTTQQDLNDQINSLKRECVGQHNRINACGVWCAIGIIAISLYRLRSWKN
jgi:hypothetical protein